MQTTMVVELDHSLHLILCQLPAVGMPASHQKMHMQASRHRVPRATRAGECQQAGIAHVADTSRLHWPTTCSMLNIE
jgi:hypothetical protein